MKPMGKMSRALKTPILAGALFLLTLAAGCAATQVYHLNMDAASAPSTFAAIASTAENLGYQVTLLSTSVNVRYDKETWIYYTIQEHDYNMVIVVDNKAVPAEKINARFQEAKAKGDEIWTKALAARQQATTPTTQPAPPAPAPAP